MKLKRTVESLTIVIGLDYVMAITLIRMFYFEFQ